MHKLQISTTRLSKRFWASALSVSSLLKAASEAVAASQHTDITTARWKPTVPGQRETESVGEARPEI